MRTIEWKLMRFRLKSSVVAIAAILAGASSVQANLLTNGSFEAVAVKVADTCGDFQFCLRSFSSTTGWTQFGDGVDLIHNNYTQPPAPVLVDASDGVQFLDMNQARVLGGIKQTVSATFGAVYQLDLDAAAWATNAIGGKIGYELYDPFSSTILANGSFTDNVGGTWKTQSLQATAISTEIGVRIQGLVALQAGMGLDNVRLNSVPAVPEPVSVPEPTAFWLLGIGLAGLGFMRRRRT
jgi:hypothetical protein